MITSNVFGWSRIDISLGIKYIPLKYRYGGKR